LAPVLYFAYGSNMLTARLTARCPSAKPLCVAEVSGHDFIYGKRGKDGSAKATLIRQDNSIVYGVLFQIAPADLGHLDLIEGRGFGYEREDDFSVVTTGAGLALKACTYLAPEEFIDRSLQPFDWYHALVLAGAAEHGLPGHYVADGIVPNRITVLDRSTSRSVEAIQILEKAGFSGFL
jgi:gamma-glutamylcyclotransferase